MAAIRYVSINCIREGMVLKDSLYNINGRLLLKEGTKINEGYKKKINEIGISGIYIKDELSKDIVIKDIINTDIRNETIKGIKTVFNNVSEDKNLNDSLNDLVNKIHDIIDNILNNDVLMVNLVDIKYFDEYTYAHSVNVAILSLIVGISIGLDKEQLYELGIGALLHDIGKIFVPEEILNKNGKLSELEKGTIEKHPLEGSELLKNNKLIPESSLLAILDHHEKWDGSGYPHGKKALEISLYGRIIAISDVYDALTSDRAYREATLSSEAMEYLLGGAGSHFDLKLVRTFFTKVATFPLGTIVKLSDGRKAIVIKNRPDFSNRPTLRVLDGSEEVLSLSDDKALLDITIVKVLKE